MSESVKIGGIGKNPAIDKINSLNSIDVKSYAVNKMEQLLLRRNSSENEGYTKTVPIDFSKADWKGESHDNRYEKVKMAENNLFRRTDMSECSTRMEKTIRRDDSKKISVQLETTGNIRKLGGKSDYNTQFDRKAIARGAGLFGNSRHTKND